MDFTKCKKSYRFYENGTEQKFGIEKDGNFYMLKFPKDMRERLNVQLSYANNVVSEHLGCRILDTIGLQVQETELGMYEDKLVVACKDFNEKGYRLVEFSGFKLGIIHGKSSDGSGTELSEIMETIDAHELIPDKETVKAYFWNLFIADALIGNFDRHNSNWGLMVNEMSKDIKPAPIYDCGSCLFPRLTDEQMGTILNSAEEKEKRIYEFPQSAIEDNGEKINYFNFISSMKNEDCNRALVNLFSKINLNEVNHLINQTPYISEVRKEFYQVMLLERYSRILAYTHKRLV